MQKPNQLFSAVVLPKETTPLLSVYGLPLVRIIILHGVALTYEVCTQKGEECKSRKEIKLKICGHRKGAQKIARNMWIVFDMSDIL